jgi:hypothetical protein
VSTLRPARRRRAGRTAARRIALERAERRDATVQRWAIALVLLSAVAIVPGALDRFVFGKLAVAAAGIALAFVAAAQGRLARDVRVLLAVGGVALVLSAVFSRSPAAALLGRSPRYEGAPVLAVYLLACVAGARVIGAQPQRRVVDHVRAVLSVAAVLVAVLAVLESVGLRPLSSTLDRPGSLLGNASDEGALAVLYAGPLVMGAVRERQRLVVAGAVAALVTVVLSASRGALLGLLVTLIVIGIASSGRYRRVVTVGGVACAALALAVPLTRDRLLGTSGFAGQTASGRTLLWRESLALYGHHPVLGSGPNQFTVAILGEHDRTWQQTVGPANPPDSPHDVLLQALGAGGPVLLLVALALAVLIGRRGVRAVREHDGWTAGVVAGLAGYAVALLFHFTSPGTTITAAFLAGAVLAEPVGPAARTSARWVAGGLAALLAAVFLLAGVGEIVLRAATDDVAHGDLAAAGSAFSAARALRPWDVDLPAVALHEFAVSAGAGNAGAAGYADSWLARTGPVAADEQVVEDHAAVLEAQQHYAPAAELLRAQLRVDHGNPLLLLRLGVLEAEQHRFGPAERDFLAAAHISPTSPEPWQDLATLYGEQGRRAAAAVARRKAVQLAR